MIYISFVEEGIMNPKYHGYRAGRIEVSYPNDIFPSEEIRFFTNKNKEFEDFRDRWDMKRVTRKQLSKIREITKGMYDR